MFVFLYDEDPELFVFDELPELEELLLDVEFEVEDPDEEELVVFDDEPEDPEPPELPELLEPDEEEELPESSESDVLSLRSNFASISSVLVSGPTFTIWVTGA